MKYRTDFVTNSSSSSYTSVSVQFKNGMSAELSGDDNEYEIPDIGSLTIESIKKVTDLQKFAAFLAGKVGYAGDVCNDGQSVDEAYIDDVRNFIAEFDSKSIEDLDRIDVEVVTFNRGDALDGAEIPDDVDFDDIEYEMVTEKYVFDLTNNKVDYESESELEYDSGNDDDEEEDDLEED